MIKVPYTSFKKIVADNKAKYTKSFLKTLDSGNYINGNECTKFENYFSNIVMLNLLLALQMAHVLYEWAWKN